MSVGMIPLGVYLSSSAYAELDLTHVPNNSVVISLSITIGCIAIGMAFRNYKEKWADRFVMVREVLLLFCFPALSSCTLSLSYSPVHRIFFLRLLSSFPLYLQKSFKCGHNFSSEIQYFNSE